MALEQHPIPQNISTYEFRLVGDMTLKQFFQLAGGIVLALIIFRLPLPAFIKYPLVLLSVTVGVLMAFIPINGRPFTQWLVAFIRAVYAPTEFSWQLLDESPVTPAASPPPPAATASIPSSVPTTTPSSPSSIDPNRVASLPPLPIVTFSGSKIEPAKPTQTLYSTSAQSAPSSPPPSSDTASATKAETPPPSTPAAPPAPAPIAPRPSAPPVPSVSTSSPLVTPPTPPPSAPPASVTNLVPPPSLPNILTGIVTDSQDKALDSAIVEIIDAKTGIPARALRTNRTGLFQIATPLSPGDYQIQVEKDNFSFPPTSIKVANTIINPIIIKASG